MNARNIFVKWCIEKLGQETSWATIFKKHCSIIGYYEQVNYNFFKLGFVNFSVPVTLHEKPKITVKDSGWFKTAVW